MRDAQRRLRWAALVLAGFLAACAAPPPPPKQARVILLPQADGSSSAVVVQARSGGALVLSQPYAGAVISATGAPQAVASSADEVRRNFGVLLDVLPARARSYVVYFETGGDRLTGESEARMQDSLADFKGAVSPEVVVIGHTDTVGTDAANDAISIRRAESIRARLVTLGIDATKIEAVGRGKRDLLVPTADNVAEPRNRRVDIRLK